MRTEIIHLKDRFPVLGEDGRDPLLELYIPSNHPDVYPAELRRPAILLCPGGGYACVAAGEWEPVVLHFLPKGFNVFVLKYSVFPHHFPVQLREVAAAMELIAEKADEYITDASRIAIMGFSAGGHLSAHYSTSYDLPQVREVFPQSRPVKASVLCYPVISALEGITHEGSIQNLSNRLEPTAEDREFFSLEKRVTDKTPPAFLWHTAADSAVPVQNSLLYAQALAEHEIPFALRIYSYGWHGLSTANPEINPDITPEIAVAGQWLNDAATWLKTVL